MLRAGAMVRLGADPSAARRMSGAPTSPRGATELAADCDASPLCGSRAAMLAARARANSLPRAACSKSKRRS